MIELSLSIKVLNSVLYEDLSFKKALKTHIPTNKSGQITLISGLVGCELRHHLLFESLLKGEYSNEQKVVAFLALANHFFYKRISEKDINEMIQTHFGDNDFKEILDLLSVDKSPIELIQYENNTPEFASIRFNTPLWIVKMWKKHYGAGNLYKVLKANSKPNPTYLKLDNSISNEEFLKKNKGNVEIDDKLNLFKVSPKFSYRSLEEVKNNQAISVSQTEIEIFKNYQNDLVNEFTIYSGSNDSFVENCILSVNSNVGINVIVPDMSKRSSLLRLIRLRKAKNINLFTAHDEVSMKCGISHKQDIIYCYPESTSFNKISSYPDYLIHVKQENLDAIIANQKSVLDNCSKFVLNDGLLVYIVDTLSKKESTAIVNDFLLNHKQFTLIQQKQYFPFENEKTTMFYAVFKLKGETND